MQYLRDYIEQRCIPIPEQGCWLWLLSIGSHGYGQASFPGHQTTTAHRVSYTAFVGPIPPLMLVQHSCDNKWCVNPDHLSLGTDKTNSDDKHRKGRANLDSRVFGPSPSRKLTGPVVEEILFSGLNEGNRVTGRRLGVDPSTVARIRSGRIYKEVHGPRRLLPASDVVIAEANRLLAEVA